MIYILSGHIMKTYYYNCHHIVFATKYRMPLITSEVLDQLKIHFQKKAIDLGIFIHIMNGYKDHVYLLISSPPRLSISIIAKNLKGYSSYRIAELRWQNGYSVFSVDAYSYDRVYHYIKNQWAHHETYPKPRV